MSWPKAKSASARSALTTVAALAAKPALRRTQPGRVGNDREAPIGMVTGRAPRTNRAAFQSLFAKFRAFSSSRH